MKDLNDLVSDCDVRWSDVVWNAYRKSGVDIDKALFSEAYVYAGKEMERVMHMLPRSSMRNLLETRIRIELQWLVEHGRFAPEDIDAKSREIADYCTEAAKTC